MLITDLDRVRTLAKDRRDAYEVMRYMLEDDETLTDADLDALVETVAAPVIAAIDCTACANCCRSLDVHVTPADADRLTRRVDVPLEALMGPAEADGEWGRLHSAPCVLLEGTRCSTYSHRPQSCRDYPALTPDFRWTLADTIEGAALCPIIMNVLERMLTVTEALSRRPPGRSPDSPVPPR